MPPLPVFGTPLERLVALASGEGSVPSRMPGAPAVEVAAIRRSFEEAAAVILYDMRVLGMPDARALVGASRYAFEAEILPRYGVSTTVPSDEGSGAGMPVRRPG